VFAGLLGGTVIALVRGWSSRPMLATWSLVWIVGLAAALWPDATTRVANAVGIRRGTDLVLYSTTVCLFVGSFMMYVRLRRVRRDITVLARKIAMMEAVEGSEPETRPDSEQADAQN
jgi:hypothetical protein